MSATVHSLREKRTKTDDLTGNYTTDQKIIS